MAQVVMEMTALAVYGSESCSGCDKAFERGELMSAVEAQDGAKLGWFCRQCLADWSNHQNAANPPVGEAAGIGDVIGTCRRRDCRNIEAG